ncbi:hypothetical protein, partial [Brevibacterium sp. ZH18]|uniref:hypothetical protein n=1 Tax=Brevibacterium sp. ZH18 TaxID=2927784 RepID=UPI001F6245C1
LLISEDSVSLLCSHVSTVPVLEWSIKETRPSRGLSGWWFSTVEGLADGAAVDVVAFGESSDRESFDAGVAADGGEEFHS